MEKDNLVFINPDNPKETLIFNFHSWAEVVRGIIVKYGNTSQEQARNLLEQSAVYKTALDSYMGVALTAHDLEYHWAMLIVHGEMYWHRGISSIEPDGYFEWEAEYRKTHNLAEESFVFE